MLRSPGRGGDRFLDSQATIKNVDTTPQLRYIHSVQHRDSGGSVNLLLAKFDRGTQPPLVPEGALVSCHDIFGSSNSSSLALALAIHSIYGTATIPPFIQ